MGRLRVETISQLLSTPNRKDEIMAAHKEQKTAHLKARGLQSQAELDDNYERARKGVETQLLIAQSYMTDHMKFDVRTRTPNGAALASEDFTFVRSQINAYFEARTPKERISVLSNMLTLICLDIEPAIRKATRTAFEVLYVRTEASKRREELILPLAIAISDRFFGTPMEKGHRENVALFLEQHFTDQVVPLAKSVKAEFNIGHRKDLAALKLQFGERPKED